MIANCGSDENKMFHGGKAGDQSGSEWCIRSWYSRPWKCVLRFNTTIGEMINELAIYSAKNNNIGYDQWQRKTYWEQLVKANYHPENIKTKCETDCSASTMSIVKATGYRLNNAKLKNVNQNLTTRGIRTACKNAGATCYTASKYLTSEKYLKVGDILLNDDHHVAIYVGDGKIINSDDKPNNKKETTNVELSVLRKGDKGNEVKSLQMLLKENGIKGTKGSTLVTDGAFGDNTLYAVKTYQQMKGLKVDGVVGNATWTKLLKG